MATLEAVTPRAYAGTPRRGPITRLLEDERWLASVLLMPSSSEFMKRVTPNERPSPMTRPITVSNIP